MVLWSKSTYDYHVRQQIINWITPSNRTWSYGVSQPMTTMLGNKLLPELPITIEHGLKGHLHQRGKRAGRPSGSRPRVPQWIGLKELCGAVYTAAGPPRRQSRPAAGARRDCSWSNSSAGTAGIGSADWSVFIDQRSSAAKWGSSKVKLRADPR